MEAVSSSSSGGHAARSTKSPPSSSSTMAGRARLACISVAAPSAMVSSVASRDSLRVNS